MTLPTNLFADLPARLHAELFTTLVEVAKSVVEP